jgi:hemin uptake protein HemP
MRVFAIEKDDPKNHLLIDLLILILGVKKYCASKPENVTGSERPEEPHSAPVQPSATAMRTLDSAELFEGRREVQIRHGGALYRLKITRQGKLILNK